MARLIDAESLDYKLEKHQVEGKVNGNRQYSKGFRDARKVIEQSPTVEPKKGKWVDNKYCSECGFSIAIDSKTELLDIEDNNFCYNCGADMREDKDE